MFVIHWKETKVSLVFVFIVRQDTHINLKQELIKVRLSPLIPWAKLFPSKFIFGNRFFPRNVSRFPWRWDSSVLIGFYNSRCAESPKGDWLLRHWACWISQGRCSINKSTRERVDSQTNSAIKLNVVPNSNLLGIKRFVLNISMSFKCECFIVMQIQHTKNLNPERFELGTT